MKKCLKMFGAAGLFAGALMVGGCGGGDDSVPTTTTTTQATSTSTTSTSTTSTTSTTTTTLPASTILDAQGTVDIPITLSAASAAFNFTDSAVVANNVIITNFGADDTITITGATSAQYDTAIQSTGSGDVIFTYNNIATGAVNKITLTGVVSSGFVYNVATFNALNVGNILFQ